MEVTSVLKKVEEKEMKQLAQKIHHKSRLFIAGTGRSGLVGKIFAMRLMHSGYNVYVVGETITPAIEKEDLFLVISGSGNTSSLHVYAKKAKDAGADISLVTTNNESSIAEIADNKVIISAATKLEGIKKNQTIQPMGNQFDQSAHLLLDAILVYLNKYFYKDNNKLINRHANLE